MHYLPGPAWTGAPFGGFLKIKDKATRIGDVKTFDAFILDMPPGVGVAAYTTAVVWCEAFSQFISAAKYR